MSDTTETGFWQAIQRIYTTSNHLFAGLIRLADLEMQLAKKSLCLILCLLLLSIILVAGFCLWCGVFGIIYLLSIGIPVMGALAIVLAFNALLILLLALWIRARFRDISFTATRKQIHLQMRGKNE